MRPARFYFDVELDVLVLETAVPLAPRQRLAAALFALPIYKQRYSAMPAGPRRDSVGRVVQKLLDMDFVERPVPRVDHERDVVAY